MSIRNNEERFGAKNAHTSGEAPPTEQPTMNFVTPTEIVELPSKGQGYAAGHPLHGKDSIEIRFMTAKDEDILTSRSLLKKGVALDKLINNLIVDKSIKGSSLLIGDRNAIIIAARSSAYGHIYETTVQCPACGDKSSNSFDLTEPQIYHGDDWNEQAIEKTERGTFLIELPHSKVIVEVKLLTGEDEIRMIKRLSAKTKNQPETAVTDQMRMFIVAVNGDTSPNLINRLINSLIVQETRYLRNAFKAVTPDLKISMDFECASCSHEQELEVAFGADFFWPDR